jgi:hypothetical protein
VLAVIAALVGIADGLVILYRNWQDVQINQSKIEQAKADAAIAGANARAATAKALDTSGKTKNTFEYTRRVKILARIQYLDHQSEQRQRKITCLKANSEGSPLCDQITIGP